MSAANEATLREFRKFGYDLGGTDSRRTVVETFHSAGSRMGRAWTPAGNRVYRAVPADNTFRLVFAIDGAISITTSGVDIRVDPGEMILLDAEADTIGASTDASARYEWQFTPTVLATPRFRGRLDEPIRPEPAQWKMLAQVTNITLSELSHGNGSFDAHVRLGIEHLCAAALSPSSRVRAAGIHAQALFSHAMDAIETRFRDPAYSVPRLAADVGVSVSTLHRVFAAMGTTPRKQIEQRRVREVQAALAGQREVSRGEVTWLAESSGFTSRQQLRDTLRRVGEVGGS